MAWENILKFEQLLRSDDAARSRLKALADGYKGNKSDVEAYFAATIGKVATDAGLPFSYEDSKALIFGQELSDEELEAVAGGVSCYWIGGSSSAEATCDLEIGAACAIIGLSIN